MGAWEMFLMILFIFPPTAIVFFASVVKLFGVLEEITITWGKAFGISAVVNVVLLFGWLVFADVFG